jgi:hypothetical protein
VHIPRWHVPGKHDDKKPITPLRKTQGKMCEKGYEIALQNKDAGEDKWFLESTGIMN